MPSAVYGVDSFTIYTINSGNHFHGLLNGAVPSYKVAPKKLSDGFREKSTLESNLQLALKLQAT